MTKEPDKDSRETTARIDEVDSDLVERAEVIAVFSRANVCTCVRLKEEIARFAQEVRDEEKNKRPNKDWVTSKYMHEEIKSRLKITRDALSKEIDAHESERRHNEELKRDIEVLKNAYIVSETERRVIKEALESHRKRRKNSETNKKTN